MALIRNVHCFSKKLDKLKKAGGKAEDAANQAWSIISDVAAREKMSIKSQSKLTPRGEARIEGCRKFDLGGGYRLLYVKRDRRYVFLFVGTHDECDTWVKNHRGINLDIGQLDSISIHDSSQPEPERPEGLPEPQADEDALLHEILDQNTLREIFCGLCGNSK